MKLTATPKLLIALSAIALALLATIGILYFFNTPHPRGSRQQNLSDKTLDQYFQQAQDLGTQHSIQEGPQTVTFLAVGDISLSRGIAYAIQKSGDPLLPFRGVEELLRSTDFNFGNLETPFSKSDAFTATETLVFNAPKTNIAGLKEYNFAVLNLANNHALDQGLDGVTTTTKLLNDNGLLHMGTGKTLDEAWAPAIIEKNGIKIGFIGASYSSINDGGQTLNNYVARIEDTQRLTSQVSLLKSRVDFIVVTMHAGTEYTPKANLAQIDFAHAAIDAGADMVIGAHPHWVQNKELYCPGSGPPPFRRSDEASAKLGQGGGRGGEDSGHSDSSSTFVNSDRDQSDRPDCKWIYYSLGNFIFDQYWSEQTKKGLALKITLSKTTAPGTTTPSINNAATTNTLQPAGPAPATTIQSIQEIPIYIKGNCCPIVDIKK